MAKPLSVIAQDSTKELRAVLARTRDEGYRKRIRAIIRIQEGELHGVVARELGASRTSLCSWIAKYNKGGFAALAPNKGGRLEGNPKWDASIFNELTKEIDKGGYWSIPRMQEWVKEQYKEDIPKQTIWYRVDQLHYSYKSARPHPTQGNKEKQESFKKGASYPSWSHSKKDHLNSSSATK
jgi:transposase